jgi:hypothetical protein
MKRASLVALLAFAGAAGSIRALLGCNAVLGIEPATLIDAGDAGGTPRDEAGQAGEAAAGDASDPLTCDNYCAVIKKNCQGQYLEYLSDDVCIKLCKYLAPGTYSPYPSVNPDNVDSLGCRLWHAHSAADDPKKHCRHAGPLGADLCGGPCNPFCHLDWRFCADDNSVYPYDGGIAECQSVCNGGAFSYIEGDSGDLVDENGMMIESLNTLNCRLWHLETAIQVNLPDPHCGHTAQQSMTCK